MVNVDVDVQDSRMVLQQLQDTEHDIVDIAETRCLRIGSTELPQAIAQGKRAGGNL